MYSKFNLVLLALMSLIMITNAIKVNNQNGVTASIEGPVAALA